MFRSNRSLRSSCCRRNAILDVYLFYFVLLTLRLFPKLCGMVISFNDRDLKEKKKVRGGEPIGRFPASSLWSVHRSHGWWFPSFFSLADLTEEEAIGKKKSFTRTETWLGASIAHLEEIPYSNRVFLVDIRKPPVEYLRIYKKKKIRV